MSATISVPSSERWLARLLSGQPHQIIGPPDRPYLLRWFIIPPNRCCNIYWHRFIGSDDPVPHDHPWDFWSLIVRNNYIEVDEHGTQRRRYAGQVAFHRAEYRHRIILDPAPASTGIAAEQVCTTLVITGPHRRLWGFWCPGKRFMPWREFGASGCGETDQRQVRP
jgi:hypothetical protein